MALAKYHLLARHLAADPGDAVTLTFAEVEALLGAPLPRSAYARSWWSAGQPSRARVWRGVGWRVQRMNPARHTVTFVRRASPVAGV